MGSKILSPGLTPSQNSRKYPSPGSDLPIWKSSLHPPSTLPVTVHPHAHPACKIFFLNEEHYLRSMEPTQLSPDKLLCRYRSPTPPPTPGILHQIYLESPSQSPHPRVPPLFGSIGFLQHLHGRPLPPPAPEMEDLQFSLHMSYKMTGRIPGQA